MKIFEKNWVVFFSSIIFIVLVGWLAWPYIDDRAEEKSEEVTAVLK